MLVVSLGGTLIRRCMVVSDLHQHHCRRKAFSAGGVCDRCAYVGCVQKFVMSTKFERARQAFNKALATRKGAETLRRCSIVIFLRK